MKYMENRNQPAYPVMMQQIGEKEFRAAKPNDEPRYNKPMAGMSKREMLAAMAMQGWLASYGGLHTVPDSKVVAAKAVEIADALLAELEK